MKKFVDHEIFYLLSELSEKIQIKTFVVGGFVRDCLLNKQSELKDIDIVCLPSWREGFPKVLMEAASLGLPVITTDVPGCRDAVIHNKTGLIVPVKDHIKLAEAISLLLKNSKLREKLGKENRLLAVKNFDLGIIIPKIIKLYS